MMAHGYSARGGGRSLWFAAFSLATVLHVSAAAFTIGGKSAQDEAAEDFGGLVVVEFAPAVASAESQEESAAPSEDSAATAPSPAVEQKKSAALQDDTPPAESSPREAPPELQLPQQQTVDKQDNPEDAQPTEANDAAPAPSASAPAAASASSAPPSMQDNATTQAPTVGSATEADEIPASWRRALVAHLGRHKRYPVEARTRRSEGDVAVRFRVNRAGQVLSASVIRSSGAPALDAAALDLLKRAQPLPAFPPSMRSGDIELVAPINFRLR